MGYLLQNDGCYSTSTISSTSNPSGRRNGTCFTTHGMYTVYIESVIVIFFQSIAEMRGYLYLPYSIIFYNLKIPECAYKTKVYQCPIGTLYIYFSMKPKPSLKIRTANGIFRD